MKSILCRLGIHRAMPIKFNDELTMRLCTRCRRMRFSFHGRGDLALDELPVCVRSYVEFRLGLPPEHPNCRCVIEDWTGEQK